MKLSADGRYKLFADCANDAITGETVAVWSAPNHTPHPSYPDTAEFLERYGSEIPEPEPTIPAPNWGGFRMGMLGNQGYQRISLLANADNNGRLALQRLELAMTADQYLPLIEALWEQIVAALPVLSKPTATEVGQWNTIATATHMQFTFKSDGTIQSN